MKITINFNEATQLFDTIIETSTGTQAIEATANVSLNHIAKALMLADPRQSEHTAFESVHVNVTAIVSDDSEEVIAIGMTCPLVDRPLDCALTDATNFITTHNRLADIINLDDKALASVVKLRHHLAHALKLPK